MKDSLKNSFRALGFPYFKEVFALIDEVMIRHQTPYYLIGATAIAVKLMQEGHRPPRGTKDIDFAVMASSLSDFDAIKEAMIAKGFNKKQDELTLYHPGYSTAIDLLPFGEVEEKDKESFTQRKIDLVVLGYREILEHTEKIKLDEQLIVDVPPLPAIAMLKLISWNDRPEIRNQDLDDIYLIISKYFEMATDELYEHHNDLFEMEPFDQRRIGSRMLGRKIGVYLQKSAHVKNRVIEILDRQINSIADDEIVVNWAQNYDIPMDDGRKIINEMLKGIKESL